MSPDALSTEAGVLGGSLTGLVVYVDEDLVTQTLDLVDAFVEYMFLLPENVTSLRICLGSDE